MIEGFYRRLVDILHLTLRRINVELVFEVACFDFYENFEMCKVTPNDFVLERSEIEVLKQVAHIPQASMRNKNEYREIICEIKNGHPEDAPRNSTLTPLTIAFIRYPLSIYNSIPNYQIWSPCDDWNPVFKYHTLLDFTLIELLSECRDNFPNPNFEISIQRAGETYLSFMTPQMSEQYREKFITDHKDSTDIEKIRMIDASNWMLHSYLNLISFQT